MPNDVLLALKLRRLSFCDSSLFDFMGTIKGLELLREGWSPRGGVGIRLVRVSNLVGVELRRAIVGSSDLFVGVVGLSLIHI